MTKALASRSAYLYSIFPSGEYPRETKRIIDQALFAPRPEIEPSELAFPIDWECSDREEDRNWRMLLQGFAMLHPLIDRFDDSAHKSEIRDYFFRILADWFDVYGDDPDDIVTSRMPSSYAWYDMSAGYRALAIAFFVERLRFFRIHLDSRQRKLLNAAAQKHIDHLMVPDVLYENNHGIFQLHGLMALAQSAGRATKQKAGNYAAQSLERLFDKQFDANGIHVEHSPEYHIVVLRTFREVFSSGWYPPSAFRDTCLAASDAAVKWLVDPLKRTAAIGDSAPIIQDVEFPETTGDGGVVLANFESSGYSVARSPWRIEGDSASYLIMVGAYNSRSHKHRDCLSFEWFEKGERLIGDSGKYGYWTDPFRDYVLSHRAHNGVEIDGFDILRMTPYGTALLPSENLGSGIVKLAGRLDFKAFTHSRNIYFNPGKWLVVEDDVEFLRPTDVTQWFHLGVDSRLVEKRDDRAIFETPRTQLLRIRALWEGTADVFLGRDQPIQGYISNVPNEIEPAFALGFRTQALSQRLLTTLALGTANEDDAIQFAQSLPPIRSHR